MLQAVRSVDAAMLWGNLHLLFWLSLLPFSTGWMGESHFARWPTVIYGLNLLLCALAYTILQHNLRRHHGPTSMGFFVVVALIWLVPDPRMASVRNVELSDPTCGAGSEEGSSSFLEKRTKKLLLVCFASLACTVR